MQVHTSEPHIEEIVIRGPSHRKKEALMLIEPMGFMETDRIPWREAFPEFLDNEQGTCLKGARLKEEMSQRELSQETGIPQRHLSEMERGKRPIGKRLARTLAKALRVDYRLFL